LRLLRIVRGNHRIALVVPVAVTVASLSVGAGAAVAGSGGTGGGGGGGVAAPQPPRLRDVTCAAKCAGIRKAVAGSKVVVSGSHLDAVKRVSFASASGKRLGVRPSAVGDRTVQAVVPKGAQSGRPKVSDSYGNAAVSPQALTIVHHLPASASFKLTEAAATARKAYYDGVRQPGVSYIFRGSGPVDVRIDVVARHTGGQVVASFVDHDAQPNTENTAHWNGKGLDGKRAPGGVYRFSIGPEAGGSVETTSDSIFQYHGYEFPVRGPHTYGDGVGAPRAGHVHEGQDVLAACGLKLVAARGGRVQYRGFQSAAGNFVVIDGKGTGHDYAYMHLKRPSPLRRGQAVRTGQQIGVVGSTGDATACHLHFEEWSAPGWYQGGHYLAAVTRHLRSWDRWS
jgi:murein DD-endopeptidase MepM/ murein hydrolase activator NlpD